MMMNLSPRFALLLTGLVILSGCVSLGGGKVPKNLITLTAEKVAPAGDLARGKPASALVLLDPETDRRLDTLRVPVQVDDSTVAYLKEATWVERPARQFRRLLAETIRAGGGQLVLEAGEEVSRNTPTLSGRLLEMGYDARSRSVIVRFDAMRMLADGTLTTRRFESVIPGISPDARAVVPALNQAANHVAAEVAAWL